MNYLFIINCIVYLHPPSNSLYGFLKHCVKGKRVRIVRIQRQSLFGHLKGFLVIFLCYINARQVVPNLCILAIKRYTLVQILLCRCCLIFGKAYDPHPFCGISRRLNFISLGQIRICFVIVFCLQRACLPRYRNIQPQSGID